MTQQGSIFDTTRNVADARRLPPEDRFRGAMVFSAVGDALGWPTEFLKEDNHRKLPFALPLRDFVAWEKLVGGRWWGYKDNIGAGDYSDDTQLTLAVARSISSQGAFEPQRFAYAEFPLWLHYERGGGRSVKTAARSLVSRKGDWLHNFYKQGKTDYYNAGANGAAMRNLPISLVACLNEERLILDSFQNAVISHGHPRAILGTILFGLATRYVLLENDIAAPPMIEYLRQMIDDAGRKIAEHGVVSEWVSGWEKKKKFPHGTFRTAFADTRQEAHRYLEAILDFLDRPAADYYHFVGALDPSTRGSGLATPCAAIYLFLKGRNDPAEAVYAAANQLGSDTDTIASFVGALAGAKFGTEVIPRHLWNKVQDREYLVKMADYMYSVAAHKPVEHMAVDTPLRQEEAYLRILAWELGLHEMFWDAIDIGGVVVHPTLGRGTIASKEVRNIARQGYVTKLIHIAFDCGQRCIFHSRVEDNDRVSESLARDVEKALRP